MLIKNEKMKNKKRISVECAGMKPARVIDDLIGGDDDNTQSQVTNDIGLIKKKGEKKIYIYIYIYIYKCMHINAFARCTPVNY